MPELYDVLNKSRSVRVAGAITAPCLSRRKLGEHRVFTYDAPAQKRFITTRGIKATLQEARITGAFYQKVPVDDEVK
jgi:hypothetical protein